MAISMLEDIYSVKMKRQEVSNDGKLLEIDCETVPSIVRHAIVLAHIAARRTDDPKVGVGAVIASTDGYLRLGLCYNSLALDGTGIRDMPSTWTILKKAQTTHSKTRN